MDNTELNDEFSIGEYIVYPPRGVGKVIKKDVREGRHYLEITLFDSDSSVLIPVDNASAMGLRALSSKEEVKKALIILSNKNPEIENDWKHRQAKNVSLLREGSLTSLATIVNVIYVRSLTKSLPVQERKIYKDALIMLSAEIAYIMNVSIEKANKVILQKLKSEK